MKYSFKILFTFSLMIICHKSFSQKSKNEARDIEEIKLIFRDFPKLKLRMPLYIELHDTVYLHPYFTSYKEYFDKRKYIDAFNWSYFAKSKNRDVKLNKHDCDELNSKILNDSNRLYIQNNWFTNNKIIILPDSIINKETNFYWKNMKPIFFRNYRRCFIAILHENGMNLFFLKKINSHWVYDKLYYLSESD